MKKLFYLFLFVLIGHFNVQAQDKLKVIFTTTHGPDGIWVYVPINEQAPYQLPHTAGLGFRDLAVVGDAIYLTTQGSDGIWKYNIGSGKAPYQLPHTAGFGFRSITVDDGFAYLTTQGPDGIFMYDLSEKYSPVQYERTKGMGFRSIAYSEGLLYLTTQGKDGIYTSDPYNLYDTEVKQLPNTAGMGFEDLFPVLSGTPNNMKVTAVWLTRQNSKAYQAYNIGGKVSNPVINCPAEPEGLYVVDGSEYYFTAKTGGIMLWNTKVSNKVEYMPSTQGLGFRNLVVTYR